MDEKKIKKLSQLKELVEQQDELKKAKNLTKKEYVDDKVKMPSPKAEKTNELAAARRNLEEGLAAIKKSIIVSISLAVVAVVGIVLCASMGIEGFGAVWGVVGFVAAVLAFVYFRGFLNINSAYKQGQKSYAKQEAECNAARAYNETEFPKLIKKYNSDCIAAEEEFAAMKQKTTKALKEIEEKIANIDIEYPSEAYFLLDRVIPILEEERADDIDDAIHIAFAEKKAYDEQVEAAHAAYKKMVSEYAEMHRRSAEEEARAKEERSAQIREKVAREMAAEKAEQARRKANSARCAHCVNAFKCSYSVQQNTDNCGGYRPRG